MGRRLAPLLVALAALTCAAPANAADYVGLGDSYSSGTGTAGSYSDNCNRTVTAYPALMAGLLPGVDTGVNLSCNGARTNNITTDAQAPANPDAQLDLPGIDAGTEWVTLQIGGNDAGFVDTLVTCGNPFGNCEQAIADAEETAETELPPKLNATYDALRAKAPNATIGIVGYPRIFRPNESCNTFFSADEVNQLNAAADKLAQITRQVAHENDLAYIDVRPPFLGHGACDSAEWINGLSGTVTNSYHPKVDGHSNGFAPTVSSGLQNVPQTTITESPGLLSNDANPLFRFTSSVASSTFQCKLDGGAFTSCTSPRQYTGVSQGAHTFQVRAINPNGDVDQFPASYAWTVDTTPPGVTLDPSGPTGTVPDDTAEFSFASADPTASLACRLDTGSFASCTSPKTYAGLDDGAHTFTIRATDPAGNTSTASRTWTVDTTAPVATVNDGPADPTPSGAAEFNFSLDDPAAVTQCRLDPVDPDPEDETTPWTSCATGQQYTGLPDGEHLFQVRGVDAIGNQGAPDEFAWTVDSTASAIDVLTGPDPLTNATAATFTFDADDPQAELTCKLDDGDFEECASGQGYSGLDEGPHTFTVKATDTALNVATDSWTWTVDTTDPDVTLNSGPEGTVTSASAELGFGSTDPAATFECKLDNDLEAAFDECTSPKQYSNLDDGPHTFDVRAIDQAGNVSTAVTRTWSVDRSLPSATISQQPANLSTDDSPTFAFTTDEPGSDFLCRIDSNVAAEFEPCESPKTYAELNDGPHSFDVRAVDAAGNVGQIDSHGWTIDTLAPTTAIDNHPAELSPLDSAAFTFHADQSGAFQCRLDGNPPAGTGWVGCGSGTVGARNYGSELSEGAHTFEVRSQDPAGNVGTPAAYAWTSDSVSPVVTLDPGGPSGLVNQTTASFTFSSSEPAAMECKLDAGAFAACPTSTTASYSGLAQGAHTFTVKASDAAGHSSTPITRTWTVDSVPPTVEITGGPSGLTNQTIAAFSFTSAGGGAAECKLDAGAFAACGSSPKTYSGLTDGAHTVTVRSTDAAGNFATDTQTWTVDATAPQTTILYGPSTPTDQTTAELQFSATESASYQCSLDGAIFAACTSPVNLSNLAKGDHNFRVRAVDLAGNMDSTPASHVWRVGIDPPASEVAGVTKKPKRCKKRASKKRCKKKRGR